MLAAMPPSVPSPALPGHESARSRGDSCPGTLRLHRADDGALARVRVPGGLLGVGQADVLRDLAERLGDGELHLTSRGNVQLRGLRADRGSELAHLLGGSGLLPSERHERARNVVASPLSGLDGQGERDIRPWLSALDELLCTSDKAAALSGRFLFALDDGRGDVGALGGDVTLTARGDEGALLRIGPARDAVLIPAAPAPRAALIAAESFLEQAPDAGAWRVTDLPGGTGPLLDTVVRRLRQAGFSPTLATAPLPQGPGAPALGIVPGPRGKRDEHDRAALSLGLPLGRVSAPQWQTLTDTARHLGSGELRLTPWRGVVLPGVERREAARLLEDLRAAGLIVGSDSPWTGVGACIGRPGCAKSLDDVRAAATAALGPVGALPVYWSGCERRCGHPHGEWVDVVATPDGHEISRVHGAERGAAAAVPGSSGGLAAAVAAARG
ncbi:precorrin-3B synthase [Streptomyces sp. NPDC058257]|uniref:precorrin-3B synthase n=1 Tax=Streptomyces sp. NPDC058257 TaxID=3346409 RepID=UPI0036F13F8D